MNDRVDWPDCEMVDHDIDQALLAAAEHRASPNDIALLAWASGRPSPIKKAPRPRPQPHPDGNPF